MKMEDSKRLFDRRNEAFDAAWCAGQLFAYYAHALKTGIYSENGAGGEGSRELLALKLIGEDIADDLAACNKKIMEQITKDDLYSLMKTYDSMREMGTFSDVLNMLLPEEEG